MRGACHCNNLCVSWQTVDQSLVPRACQCDYCFDKGAAWVSKSGTRFILHANRAGLHRGVSQGNAAAVFHECANCGDVVCVTALIDGERYGALNAALLHNPAGFENPVPIDVEGLSVPDKLARWRENWCHPVEVSPPLREV